MQLPVAYSMFLCFAASAIFAACSIVFPGFVMRLFTTDAQTIACGIPYLQVAGFTYLMLAISLPIASAMRAEVYPAFALPLLYVAREAPFEIQSALASS